MTTAVIRHGLVAAGDEMMTNVKRAAYSPSIHQIQDVCVGLVDPDRTASSRAPPGCRCSSPTWARSSAIGLELVGLDAFEPGDVYISNDPFTIGTHINNVATYSPIFIDGVLVAFAVVRGHMVDMGGAVPGIAVHPAHRDLPGRSARPSAALLRRGRRRWTPIHRLIADNTRMPGAVLGDLRAQVAACRTGERRLDAMIQRYGRAQHSKRRSATSSTRANVSRVLRCARSRTAPTEPRLSSTMTASSLGERVPIRVVVEVSRRRDDHRLLETSPIKRRARSTPGSTARSRSRATHSSA